MNRDAPAKTIEAERRAVDERRARWRHHLLMFACCVPMLLVVGVLVASGTLSVGAAVFALLCVVLMPLLHGSGSHGHRGGHRH